MLLFLLFEAEDLKGAGNEAFAKERFEKAPSEPRVRATSGKGGKGPEFLWGLRRAPSCA